MQSDMPSLVETSDQIQLIADAANRDDCAEDDKKCVATVTGTWDWNVAAETVSYSSRWKAMLGYHDHEIESSIGEWLRRVHADDYAACWTAIDKQLQGHGSEFSIEHRIRTKKGQWRRVHGLGRVVERDAAGLPMRIVGSHVAVTEHARSHAHAQDHNERLNLAKKVIGGGFFRFDVERHLCRWDTDMHRIYGVPQGGYDGTLDEWARYLHPDDGRYLQRALAEHLSGRDIVELEFRILRGPEKTVRRLRCALQPVHDAQGRLDHVLGVNWDVTQAWNPSGGQKIETSWLQATLQSIGDAVVATDNGAKIVFMNALAERLTGWTAEAAIGLPAAEVLRIVDDLGVPLLNLTDASVSPRDFPPMVEEGILLARNGDRRSIRATTSSIQDASGADLGGVMSFHDITMAKRTQRALEHSASHDSLTGLPNRLVFDRELRHAVGSAANQGRIHTLCYVDLDRFKLVNDGAGHAAGDTLLRDISAMLRRNSRAHDVAARIGGDEFALILLDCPVDKGARIAEQIREEIERIRFTWNDDAYYVSASIGLAEIGPMGLMEDELVNRADIACYAAKSAGGNRVSIHEQNSQNKPERNGSARIAAGLRNSIESDRFCLHAQEICRADGKPQHKRRYEILVRLIGEHDELIAPDAFIPAAEAYNLMGEIDRWVVRSVFRNYGSRLKNSSDIGISLNLSSSSLGDRTFWPFVQDELAAVGLSGELVNFEISESSFMQSFSDASRFAAAAREAGCTVSLDDFGQNLGSFNHLSQMRVDAIKIDGGLVGKMTHSDFDVTVVEAISAICRGMGHEIIAEQVEDDRTLELLKEVGVDYVQGFAIARPRRLDELL